MKAERIFINGNIYTMDDEHPRAEAIAVSGQTLLYVGSEAEAMAMKDEGTEVVDLQGKTVLPGICECHGHLMSVAAGDDIDAAGKTKEEILALVKECAQEKPKGQWITGHGWNQDFWEVPEFPMKEELDAVAPDHPVSLNRYCGNAIWCNSLALSLAGLNAETVKGESQEYLLNDEGELLGVLVGPTANSINAVIPEPTLSQKKKMILGAQETMFRYGVTSFMNKGAGITSTFASDCGREITELIHGLYDEGLLKFRLYDALVGTDEYFEDVFAQGPVVNEHDDRYTMRCIKLWEDGAMGPRTAWLSADYRGREGHRGNQKISREDLLRLFRKADERGIQIAVHTIGDAASQLVLDCYEEVFGDSGEKDRRFLIEHFHMPSPEDVRRLVDNQIIMSTQFIQFASDVNVVGNILPDELIPQLYPWRKVWDLGGIVCNGSDVPGDPLNPFPNLYVGITRLDLNGNNVLESTEGKTLTRFQALQSCTVNAAYAQFREKELGSLTPGKLADFIVIDRDYFTCPVEEIKEIQVEQTFVGGECVYGA